MRVEQIIITSNKDYKSGIYQYNGKLKIAGDSATIELNINDEMCRKVIELCADNLVEVAQETSKLMKAEIIEQTKLIEG